MWMDKARKSNRTAHLLGSSSHGMEAPGQPLLDQPLSLDLVDTHALKCLLNCSRLHSRAFDGALQLVQLALLGRQATSTVVALLLELGQAILDLVQGLAGKAHGVQCEQEGELGKKPYPIANCVGDKTPTVWNNWSLKESWGYKKQLSSAQHASPVHLDGRAGDQLELQHLLVLGIDQLQMLLVLDLELVKVHRVQHLAHLLLVRELRFHLGDGGLVARVLQVDLLCDDVSADDLVLPKPEQVETGFRQIPRRLFLHGSRKSARGRIQPGEEHLMTFSAGKAPAWASPPPTMMSRLNSYVEFLVSLMRMSTSSINVRMSSTSLSPEARTCERAEDRSGRRRHGAS